MVVLQKNHDCSAELREVSLKATPIRIGVLSLLEETTSPIDIATILKELKKKKIVADPATVFRIMNSFVEKNLVREIHFREDKTRYELASKDDHHHLLCQECGAIEDISDCHIEGLEKEIITKKHFLIKSHSLEFFGICKNCQK